MIRHLREWTDPPSEENDQLTKQLDPQEVGSLVRNQPKTEGFAETAGEIICNDSK